MLFNMVGKSSGGGDSPTVNDLTGIRADATATLAQSNNALFEYTIKLPRAGIYLLDFTWRFYYPNTGAIESMTYYRTTSSSNLIITNGTYEALLYGYGGAPEFIFRITANNNCVFKIRHTSGTNASVTMTSQVMGYLYYSGETISSLTKSIAIVS